VANRYCERSRRQHQEKAETEPGVRGSPKQKSKTRKADGKYPEKKPRPLHGRAMNKYRSSYDYDHYQKQPVFPVNPGTDPQPIVSGRNGASIAPACKVPGIQHHPARKGL
jgi:hypothetical protein